MKINRRELLTAGAALLASTSLFACTKRAIENQWLVSAGSDRAGNHYALAVSGDGQMISKVPLPQRAHDALALPHKPGHALVFARRPDRFLLEIDFIQGVITRQITSQDDTHFYGHGVLSADQKYLFTTENHFAKGRGLVVVRDNETYQELARYDSGGVGPHELALMPDAKHLVIANGGILTHPMTPRVKLNLNSMQPNLTYLEIDSGKIIGQFTPPHHQQSLRHLDVAADGSVFVGVQYQGTKSDAVPLLYGHKGEHQLQPFETSPEQWLSMGQYTASVLVDRNLITVSCPRADQVTYWHKQKLTFVGKDTFKDVAGLAHVNGRPYASNGRGQLMDLTLKQPFNVTSADLMFDNHMTHIQAV